MFKQLFEKDLVYRGFKVMPFSTACSTSLSNFEAGLNYKDVNDPAVMVSWAFFFHSKDEAETCRCLADCTVLDLNIAPYTFRHGRVECSCFI